MTAFVFVCGVFTGVALTLGALTVMVVGMHKKMLKQRLAEQQAMQGQMDKLLGELGLSPAGRKERKSFEH
ncbi:MAG: P27 family phage terminase small subunit [Acidobacteriales bacterium]|nr:P27 family phage terminase small subunit [Terriglobales bacterium]